MADIVVRVIGAIGVVFLTSAAGLLGLAAWSGANLYLAGFRKRAQELIEALLRGGGVATIASYLGITQNTVRNHLKSIFRKLEVHSQTELVRSIRLGEFSFGRSP